MRWMISIASTAMLSLLCGCETESATAPTSYGGSGSVGGAAAGGWASGGSSVGGTGGEAPDPCTGHCHNGSQDCGEVGTDCGGACSSCNPEMLWGPDTLAARPSVLATAPDRVMVAFGTPGRTTPVRFSCYDGSTWSALADVSDFNSWRPNPALDAAGNIHMTYNAYQGPGPQSVYYSVYSGSCPNGTWSSPELVSDGSSTTFSSTEPCTAIDDNGVPWVAWAQARGVAITNESCGSTADCVASLGSEYYCRGDTCWPYYDALVSRRIDGAWEQPRVVNEGMIGYFGHVALAVVQGDLAFASFFRGESAPYRVWLSHWDGTSWSTPENTTLGQQFSELVADDNHVHLLVNGSTRYARRPIAGPWEPAVSLGSGALDIPDLVLDHAGVLHALWRGAEDQIHYRIGDGATGSWTEPAVVVSTDTASSHPWISVDDGGYAHMVWTGGNDGGPLWYFRARYQNL